MSPQQGDDVTQPETPHVPKYGELAPEGWSWSPENAAEPPAPAAGDRLSGVPHNLGVGSAPQQPQQPQSAPASAPRDPYRAEQPPAAPQQWQAAPGGAPGQPGQPGQPGVPRPRTGDRVATIILLVVGALGALYFAAAMQQLPSSLALMARIIGLDSFVVPAAAATIGTVGAILVLVIYAVNLILALQRLRHKKLAFWIPLVAAAVAFVVVITCTIVAIDQAPELLQQFIDYASEGAGLR